MNLPSKILEEAVNEFSSLPSIGKKSALRFVLHLLKQSPEDLESLAQVILKLKNDIIYCESCFNISNQPVCEICSNPNRENETICVVEDIRDVMAIENTSQYRGLYHVLGGKINPMEGIGPSQLTIKSLIEKARNGEVEEIIFALSSTLEGDTTNFYIFKQLEGLNIKTSTIARGISVGDELEYADEVTLGRSITNRIPFESSLRN